MSLQGFGQRVRRAWHRWASQNSDAVTYEDFGKAIADEEKRTEGPYRPSAISEWISERTEPKAKTYRAMAALTGFRVEWLMEGKLPERDDEGGQGAKNGNPHPASPTRHRFVETPVEVETLRPRPKGKPVTRKPGKSAIA